jgi:tetratricopeptide (TPR) repeat protein
VPQGDGSMTESGRASHPTRAGRWVLAAAIAGAALAIGTVHTITLCIVTGALALAAGLVWWNGEDSPFRPRPAATLLLGTGIVLTAYTALQSVPMPVSWLAKLAPHNADVWSRTLTPLREAGPSWAPISLDPIATRVEVLKGVAYVLAFVTALRVARRRDGTAFLSATLMITGGVLAVAAVLHPAFGAKKLYGVFEPSPSFTAYDRHLAPFLNPNNLAAYLNVALCLALAAALAPEPRVPRPLTAAVALLLVTTQVWVASRGGVGAMVLGVLLVVVICLAPRMKQPRPLARASLFAGVVVAAGGVMAVFGSSDPTASELLDRDVSKLQLFRQAMRMVPSYPIWGTGRGAFESTFPAFLQSPGSTFYTHPENVIVQWVVEWGVPIGVAGLVAVAWALRPGTALARSSTAAGAWAGIVAVAVQNLADLGSEIPGLALAPIVCAAIVVAGTAGGRPRGWLDRWVRSPRTVALAGVGAAACAVAAAAGGIGHELKDERAALYDQAMSRQPPAAAVTLGRASMLRHPAERYLPFIVGWRLAQTPNENAVAWIGAALDRTRVYGPAHLVLARILASRSPSQARLEYRLATEQALQLAALVVAEGPPLVRTFDDAMELVADGRAGDEVLDGLAQALPARLPATCVRLDDELERRAPTDPAPWLRRADRALEDVRQDAPSPWCEGAARGSCVEVAMKSAERAEQLAPAKCAPYAAHARALASAGDGDRGLEELSQAAGNVYDRMACLEELVTLAGAAHDGRRAEAAMDRIVASGCAEDSECAGNLAWVADAAERIGNRRKALALFKRAYERLPESDSLLQNVARLAASSGMHVEAAEDYGRLARKHPADPRWRKAADEERDAALGAATAR